MWVSRGRVPWERLERRLADLSRRLAVLPDPKLGGDDQPSLATRSIGQLGEVDRRRRVSRTSRGAHSEMPQKRGIGGVSGRGGRRVLVAGTNDVRLAQARRADESRVQRLEGTQKGCGLYVLGNQCLVDGGEEERG